MLVGRRRGSLDGGWEGAGLGAVDLDQKGSSLRVWFGWELFVWIGLDGDG